MRDPEQPHVEDIYFQRAVKDTRFFDTNATNPRYKDRTIPMILCDFLYFVSHANNILHSNIRLLLRVGLCIFFSDLLVSPRAIF